MSDSDGTLERILETERARVLEARSVLKYLCELLLHAEYEEAAIHAQTAQVAVQLIEEAVERLGAINVRPLQQTVRTERNYERQEEKLERGTGAGNEVREPAVTRSLH